MTISTYSDEKEGVVLPRLQPLTWWLIFMILSMMHLKVLVTAAALALMPVPLKDSFPHSFPLRIFKPFLVVFLFDCQ